MASAGLIDDDPESWLQTLRDGSFWEKAEARSRLATVFEHRGMLGEAIVLLETNLILDAGDDWQCASLLRLYRLQGAAAGSSYVLTDRDDDLSAKESPGFIRPTSPLWAPVQVAPGAATSYETTPALEASLAPLASVASADGMDSSDHQQPAVSSRGVSVRPLLLAGLVGALSTVGLFSLWQRAWWLLADVVVIVVVMLAACWLAHSVRRPVAVRLAPLRFRAVGGLTILALLVVVVALDARVRAPTAGGSAKDLVGEPPVPGPASVDVPAATTFASPVPIDGLSAPALSAEIQITTLAGALVRLPRQTPDRSPPASTRSDSSSRQPELQVVGADGGVWLRSAPGDGVQIALLPNGARLADLGQRQDSGGQGWRHVRERGTGEGWIAEAFVIDAATARGFESTRRLRRAGIIDGSITAEAAGLLVQLQSFLTSTQRSYAAVLTEASHASERPSLLTDPRWRADLAVQAATVRARSRELQALRSTGSGDHRLVQTVNTIGRVLVGAVDELEGGIDSLDPGRIAAARDRLQATEDLFDRASLDLLDFTGRR